MTDLHRMEERYARQILLAELGPEGQAALARSAVLVLGCWYIERSGEDDR